MKSPTSLCLKKTTNAKKEKKTNKKTDMFWMENFWGGIHKRDQAKLTQKSAQFNTKIGSS